MWLIACVWRTREGSDGADSGAPDVVVCAERGGTELVTWWPLQQSQWVSVWEEKLEWVPHFLKSHGNSDENSCQCVQSLKDVFFSAVSLLFLLFYFSSFLLSHNPLFLCLGDGNSKISSVYINNTHGLDDDDFYDRNLALFEVQNAIIIKLLSTKSTL